jgi:hypothetical protein
MNADANSNDQLIQHVAEQVSHLLDQPGLRQLTELARETSTETSSDGAAEGRNEPA